MWTHIWLVLYVILDKKKVFCVIDGIYVLLSQHFSRKYKINGSRIIISSLPNGSVLMLGLHLILDKEIILWLSH